MTPKKDAAPIQLPLLMYAGFAAQWECDHVGHLAAPNYTNRAYQGWGAFAAAINLPNAFLREAPSTLLPRDIHIRYHREARAGDFMVMHGGVVEIGEDYVVLFQELRKPAGDELMATLRVVLSHVESKSGRPFPWPKKALGPLAQLKIAGLPAHGAARSLDLSAPATSASLQAAEKLGVPIAGQTMVSTPETDAFGRVRPEIALFRQGEAFGAIRSAFHDQLIEALTNAGLPPRFSAAALETRVAFHRWPTIGNVIQTRGALTQAEGKIVRFCAWLLDPVQGDAWAECEVVIAHFDMQTRKSYVPPAELEAVLKNAIVPGFGL